MYGSIFRSSRFDETEYDDGAYSSKYDYDDKKEDEFLKTAHSQNIAASRNELAKSTRQQPEQSQTTYFTQSTQRQFQSTQRQTPSTQRQTQSTQRQTPSTQKVTYQTPKPFSVTPAPQEKSTSDFTRPSSNGSTKPSQAPAVNHSFNLNPKKTKDVSYDYAYYDSGAASEADYEIDRIDTEIKKSTVKN